MREAVGNAFVVNIVILFLFLIMFVFVGTISYSKAFKIKNRIVNYIEEQDGQIYNTDRTKLIDNGIKNAKNDIDEILSHIGYQIRIGRANCKISKAGGNLLFPADDSRTSGYNYCIVMYNENNGDYYFGVTTFMKFEIPIINYWLEFPVYGETKTFKSILK